MRLPSNTLAALLFVTLSFGLGSCNGLQGLGQPSLPKPGDGTVNIHDMSGRGYGDARRVAKSTSRALGTAFLLRNGNQEFAQNFAAAAGRLETTYGREIVVFHLPDEPSADGWLALGDLFLYGEYVGGWGYGLQTQAYFENAIDHFLGPKILEMDRRLGWSTIAPDVVEDRVFPVTIAGLLSAPGIFSVRGVDTCRIHPRAAVRNFFEALNELKPIAHGPPSEGLENTKISHGILIDGDSGTCSGQIKIAVQQRFIAHGSPGPWEKVFDDFVSFEQTDDGTDAIYEASKSLAQRFIRFYEAGI